MGNACPSEVAQAPDHPEGFVEAHPPLILDEMEEQEQPAPGVQEQVAEAAAAQAAVDKYTKVESLIAAAEGGDTRLVSARWLLEFDSTRGEDVPLSRQQDLPPRAFVDPAQLRARGISKTGEDGEYVVLALSYCWLTAAHPDPRGEQLGTLARVLALMMHHKEYRACADVAVFIDFASLPQRARSAKEEAAFQRGLQDVNLWYAHTLTWVFMLTELPMGWPDVRAYAERGWPTFERRISSLLKDSRMCLDLRRIGDGQVDFGGLRDRCKLSRCPPQSPEAFAEAVRTLRFTDGTDLAFVQAKYRQTAVDLLAGVAELNFLSLGWGPREAEDLAQALPLAAKLRTLELSWNRLADAGAAALAQALPRCLALEQLRLASNEVGDDGAAALAAVLPSCRALKDFSLWGNKVADAGALELARALPACPALRSLTLSFNADIGVSVCQALHKAAGARVSLYLPMPQGLSVRAEGGGQQDNAHEQHSGTSCEASDYISRIDAILRDKPEEARFVHRLLETGAVAKMMQAADGKASEGGVNVRTRSKGAADGNQCKALCGLQ